MCDCVNERKVARARDSLPVQHGEGARHAPPVPALASSAWRGIILAVRVLNVVRCIFRRPRDRADARRLARQRAHATDLHSGEGHP